MRLLLDTHALIWWWANDRRLSDNGMALIGAPENMILISPVSAWEIATKFRIGKLPGAEEGVANFAAWTMRDAFQPLTITLNHALMAGGFSAPHADPFDRMLAAQAMVEGIPILSCDTALDVFGCQRIWE
ncbi:type II toxin-antitoxin system VapC family toxin [Sphingomonas sp.]|uniref:type II toxin-antitoxin system VapC family toxin n=1 Tax=Sphingomonas sp. TaxID=28214 RepID=UPI0025E9605E|nr:type II toxin-antitoxin system VapC family toxin [Sphingomonas sp.]